MENGWEQRETRKEKETGNKSGRKNLKEQSDTETMKANWKNVLKL